MTENEAMERFQKCVENNGKCECCEFYANCGIYEMEELAINALEEVQQYRQIGTVEECRKSVEICKSMIGRNITPENMEEYMKFED